MKLHLETNLIRLRLSREEIMQLIKENILEETFTFGADQALRYCLQISYNITALQASFRMGEVLIKVPHEMSTHWALSKVASIEATQETDGHAPLQILIEKDFV